MPNNKKQRGREEKKKRNQAQQEAKEAAEEQQAWRKAEEARVRLRGLFGTPAIDELIADMSRSTLSTAAAAVASKSSSSFPKAEKREEDAVFCFHSSSAEHFVAGSEFLKIVKSYVVLDKKYIDNEDQRNPAHNKFFAEKENKNVYLDGEFTNFVFALGVSLYLNLSSEEKERYYKLSSREQKIGTAYFELLLIIELGLNIKYIFVPFLDKTKSQQKSIDDREKAMKYLRDIGTERGLINCLHRETKQYCDCMASKKDEAKGMCKMERCNSCRREFLKKLMKKCDGCESVVYCSKKCCKNDWSYHKIACELEKKKQAAHAMKKTVAIGSQHPYEEEGSTHHDSSDDGNSSREEKPATSKGIAHGTCDGNGNIGSCGHEMEGDDTVTTKKMKATVPLDAHSLATNAAINTATHQAICETEKKKLAANTMNNTDDGSDGGGDNEFDMNLFGDNDETLGDTTAVAPSSSSHITINAMTAAAAPFTSAGDHGNSGDLPVAVPARAALADNA